MVKFASLGSGSSGNATLVSLNDTLLLVDCGFTTKDVEKRLARLNVRAEDISAILVTHEHGDHAKGVAPFSRKYNTPVYMSHGTFVSRTYGRLTQLHMISEGQDLTIGDIFITPVTVPHDAREPLQFVFSAAGLKLGILTDLGSSSERIIEAYSQCDALMLEANHDPVMLANGAYPPSVRSRVGGHWGHLNNQQTAALLSSLSLNNIQHLVVGHISQQNNTIEKVKAALSHLDDLKPKMRFANQNEGFDWLQLI